uniref:Ig-like domain-containing protein n=1 Tax=Myotis lucifugus TaxID=59463 RepID=L7N1V5_MYOLU
IILPKVFKNLQTTSLSILEGEALRLRCEADSNPPAELSWFWGSPGLNATPLSSTAILELPRVGPAQEGEFTCQARHPLGSHSVSLILSVVYAPQNLTIGVSFRNYPVFKNLQTTSLSILEGEALRLRCEADSNPPAELSWFWGSPGLNATPLSSTAILELPRVGPAQEGEFTCQARHPLGSHSVSLILSVVYPPQLLGPSCSWEDQGLHCSCSSRAQPAPSLRWWLGVGLLEGNHSNTTHEVTSSSEGPWTNSSLSLLQGLSPDLRLICEARNVHGAQSVSVLLLPGKAVPQAGAVPAALGGAGAVALLSLCLCLIFLCIVKARRRQAAGRPKVRGGRGMSIKESTLSSSEVPQTHSSVVRWTDSRKLTFLSFPGTHGTKPPKTNKIFKKNLQPDGPPDQASPAEKGPLSGKQKELYYANLTFEGLKPREPRGQEATSTQEYAVVKRR